MQPALRRPVISHRVIAYDVFRARFTMAKAIHCVSIAHTYNQRSFARVYSLFRSAGKGMHVCIACTVVAGVRDCVSVSEEGHPPTFHYTLSRAPPTGFLIDSKI